jgi:hypothetical protein
MTQATGATVTIDGAAAATRHTHPIIEATQAALVVGHAGYVVAAVCSGSANITALMALTDAETARHA